MTGPPPPPPGDQKKVNTCQFGCRVSNDFDLISYWQILFRSINLQKFVNNPKKVENNWKESFLGAYLVACNRGKWGNKTRESNHKQTDEFNYEVGQTLLQRFGVLDWWEYQNLKWLNQHYLFTRSALCLECWANLSSRCVSLFSTQSYLGGKRFRLTISIPTTDAAASAAMCLSIVSLT